MDKRIKNSEIKELSENICLFSDRINTLIKYFCVSDEMDINTKTIMINLISKIAQNIKIETENLKYIL